MIKSICTSLIVLSGTGLLATGAGATTIRTAGPDEPIMSAASYGYRNYVVGTSDGLYQTGISSDNQKSYPVSNSISGQRYITLDGGQTLLTNTATARVSDDHLGTVQVSAKTTNDQAIANAYLRYSFILIGPDAAYVPVTISAYGYTELHPGDAGFASATATLSVSNLNPFTNSRDYLIEDVSDYEHHPLDTTVNVKPNITARDDATSIGLDVTANVGSSTGGVTGCTDGRTLDFCYAGSASAYVDPLISIADPTLAPLYTIVVSLSSVPDSIVPVSPVPLPRSLPMFGAGLLALCAWSYAAGHRKNMAL